MTTEAACSTVLMRSTAATTGSTVGVGRGAGVELERGAVGEDVSRTLAGAQAVRSATSTVAVVPRSARRMGATLRQRTLCLAGWGLCDRRESALHTLGCGAPCTVRADRARRRSVADQLDARVGDRGGPAAVPVELDAALRAAQMKRREVCDSGA